MFHPDRHPDLHSELPGVLNAAERAELAEMRRAALDGMAELPDFEFGETPDPALVAAWDIEIGPDGAGLPPGSGSAEHGKALYLIQCVQCHGVFGEGAEFEALAGRAPGDRFRFGDEPTVPITVGSYWPYATTLFDYIRRAMPQAAPGTLSPEDTYALTAHVLVLNGLLPEDASLDAASLPKIVMPARGRFVPDDRRGGAEVR